jgi:hypothetical protein
MFFPKASTIASDLLPRLNALRIANGDFRCSKIFSNLARNLDLLVLVFFFRSPELLPILSTNQDRKDLVLFWLIQIQKRRLAASRRRRTCIRRLAADCGLFIQFTHVVSGFDSSQLLGLFR